MLITYNKNVISQICLCHGRVSPSHQIEYITIGMLLSKMELVAENKYIKLLFHCKMDFIYIYRLNFIFTNMSRYMDLSSLYLY